MVTHIYRAWSKYTWLLSLLKMHIWHTLRINIVLLCIQFDNFFEEDTYGTAQHFVLVFICYKLCLLVFHLGLCSFALINMKLITKYVQIWNDCVMDVVLTSWPSEMCISSNFSCPLPSSIVCTIFSGAGKRLFWIIYRERVDERCGTD